VPFVRKDAAAVTANFTHTEVTEVTEVIEFREVRAGGYVNNDS
jgi:hypothetical protein